MVDSSYIVSPDTGSGMFQLQVSQNVYVARTPFQKQSTQTIDPIDDRFFHCWWKEPIGAADQSSAVAVAVAADRSTAVDAAAGVKRTYDAAECCCMVLINPDCRWTAAD